MLHKVRDVLWKVKWCTCNRKLETRAGHETWGCSTCWCLSWLRKRKDQRVGILPWQRPVSTLNFYGNLGMFSLIIGNSVAACSSILTNPFRHLSSNICPPPTHTHTIAVLHFRPAYRHRKDQVYLSNTKKPIGGGEGKMTTHFILLYFSDKTLDALLLELERRTCREQISTEVRMKVEGGR